MAGHKVEVEFRIREDGRIELTVQGQPGPSCVDVARLFESLGETVEERRTSEFYQGGARSEVGTRQS